MTRGTSTQHGTHRLTVAGDRKTSEIFLTEAVHEHYVCLSFTEQSHFLQVFKRFILNVNAQFYTYTE